jgi:hypothetical protein
MPRDVHDKVRLGKLWEQKPLHLIYYTVPQVVSSHGDHGLQGVRYSGRSSSLWTNAPSLKPLLP